MGKHRLGICITICKPLGPADFLSTYPEQCFWFKNRWKKRQGVFFDWQNNLLWYK